MAKFVYNFMRKTIIAGNWKMNKTAEQAVLLVKELKGLCKDCERMVIVCPPFTALYPVREECRGSKIKLGAQNMFFEKEGAYTGEISPLMLKELAEFVIIGHSERRHIFNEGDEIINKKIKAALLQGLKPIFCVGETLDEREKGKTEGIIEGQIKNGLKGIDDIKEVIIAYEPVWAIGTGKNATPSQAEEVHVFIRGILESMYDKERAGKIRILYGGSVKPSNAKELINKENIDGALVGGASLDAKSFYEIIKC
jgi:triosephosphate isomerase